MKKFLSLLLFVVGINAFAYSQNIILQEDYSVTELMEKYTQLNKSTRSVDGWRVQILATTDRSKMERIKRQFLQNYPEVHLDWIHAKPYYKLRAGAFANKLEASRLLYKLKRDYPSAFPTKDDLRPAELVGL